jgi:2-dehydro-3-deoxyphosphogalactonate aldolase
VTTDPRSERVALVADALLEERLDELHDGGWGVIQLPPASLDATTAQEWLALAAEQAAEYQRTGYEVVLIDDGTWRDALATALERLGAEPLRRRAAVRITELRTFVVDNPPPHFGGRYFVFLKLVTADGVEGVGEVYGATFGPQTVVQMIEDVFAHHVEGADPFQIELLWRNVYGRGYSGRPDVSLGSVLSGIELACWDIVGKAVEKPVHDLLGGRVHERLRTYTYLYPEERDRADVYLDPELAAERAAEYVARGFTAVKFDPAGSYSTFDPRQPSLEALARCKRYVRAVREAVGESCDLLIGTHGQFTPSGALRLARLLEPFDPLWLEEPTPPEAPEQMALVARGTSIPIATGERLTTKYEFARVLATAAASVLQPNLGRVGGLLEAKKIAGMAEAHYAQIAPHLYCGPVVGAASIQLGACSPNLLMLEGILDWGGFAATLLREPIRWEDGHVIPSNAPGLGIELDEEVARAHPYAGDELHLSPAYGPVR